MAKPRPKFFRHSLFHQRWPTNRICKAKSTLWSTSVMLRVGELHFTTEKKNPKDLLPAVVRCSTRLKCVKTWMSVK